ncbi:hypothetical protein DM860_014467 [Cuscuta australis]|uniref:BHLH domain-containing protein n=1 Tax=Cuscuta australis TaxID=267555 RepID=A0A328DXR3_9ASTE|nr:hypothetical protein DM860_014467 [Cuscuta australis]
MSPPTSSAVLSCFPDSVVTANELPAQNGFAASKVSDIMISNASGNLDSVLVNSGPVEASACKGMQKQEASVAKSRPTLLNFFHFFRSLGRVNLESANCVRPPKPPPGKTCSTLKTETDLSDQTDLQFAKIERVRATDKTHEELFTHDEPNISLRDGPNPNLYAQFIYPDAKKGVRGGDTAVEAGVACSSVCSGYSPERSSNDHSNSLKRKNRDDEESGFPNDDTKNECNSLNTIVPDQRGLRSKRSRAAELLNLSQRRRRNKINEKMRALQELIPNCNKTDKASILDEAILYLKTLQLQVQIMSMGTGFCMPQMMYPAGMHAAQMQQFPLMGLGVGINMGMIMGFGMRMQAMNGGSPVCSSSSIPLMQQAQMSSTPFSGPSSFFPTFCHSPSLDTSNI